MDMAHSALSTLSTVVLLVAAELHVTDAIPAWNKYWYGLHVVVQGLAVCVCEFQYF